MSTETSWHLLKVSKKILWSPILYTFLMILYMYIAPGQGLRQPLGNKILMPTERPYHFAHLLQVSKKSHWNLILYILFHALYMYIAPGQRQTTPWGQNFDVNRKALPFCHCCKFKKNLYEVWFYTHFLMILYIYIAAYIALGQGQTTPWGQHFYVNRKALSLCTFVASLKKISLKFDFIHVFHVFIHVYIAPG